MKTFTVAVLALLTLAAASAPAADGLSAAARQKGPCQKVQFSRKVRKTGCKRGKQVNVLDMTVVLAPVDVDLRITLRCIAKGRATNVTRRILKCAKLLLKRCRCVTDDRKRFCVLDQVNTCSQQFRFEVIPRETPGP